MRASRSVSTVTRRVSIQVHLDAPGGMAGDMFVAAVLHAFPEHEAGVLASVAAAAGPVAVRTRLVPHHDGVLNGRRFLVQADEVSVADFEQHEHEHGRHVRNEIKPDSILRC